MCDRILSTHFLLKRHHWREFCIKLSIDLDLSAFVPGRCLTVNDCGYGRPYDHVRTATNSLSPRSDGFSELARRGFMWGFMGSVLRIVNCCFAPLPVGLVNTQNRPH